MLFANVRPAFGQGSHFLLYQVVVIIAAVVGGAAPAVAAALLASAALNWYFTPPFHTWTVDEPENALALVVFLIVGVLASLLVTALARQTADARRGRAEAEALARIAGGLVTADDPLPPMLERVRTLLGLDAIAVYGPDGTVLAHTGETLDPAAESTIDLPDGRVAIGGSLGPDDKLVLEAFTAQLATVLERRRLRREAASAAALAEADSFRTALLRAVSHDLRTPLASIKASVTSLLQRDVDWSRAESDEFLATIDEEADRLDNVIGNLLDASRLEAGALRPVISSVALDEVVPSALTSVSGLGAGIDIDIDPSLPLVLADAGLLERAIANIAANADRADPGGTIRIAASQLGDLVELRIVDHGPGLPASERTTMFEPFQRLGDSTNTDGVGLGLAVAQGIIDAMGGSSRHRGHARRWAHHGHHPARVPRCLLSRASGSSSSTTSRRSVAPSPPTSGRAATSWTSPRPVNRPSSWPPTDTPTSSCSTSACPASTGSRSSAGCGAGPRSPSSCSRSATTNPTRSTPSTPAPTTTSPSRSG